MSILLELLLNNIVVVIIVIGFLFSFFSKLKQGNSSGTGKPIQRMPSFGGSDPANSKDFWEPRPLERKDVRNTSTLYTASLEPMEKRVEEWSEQIETFPSLSMAEIDPVKASSLYDMQRSGEKEGKMPDLQFDITAAEAVKGMVWSEILGPPRAKKSLSHRK